MAVKIFRLKTDESFKDDFDRLEKELNDFLYEFEIKNIPTNITVTNNNVVYVFHPIISEYERKMKEVMDMRQQQQEGLKFS